jgi:hypothetical protein
MKKEDEGASTDLFQLLQCAFTFHPSPFTLYPSLVAILALAACSAAAWPGFNQSQVQSHGLGPHEANAAFQLHADRSPVTASKDESHDAPKTFVDMTPAELAKAVPELRHLQPAESQDMLPQILQRVGADVAAFFANFPNTTCTEYVTSTVDTPSQTAESHYYDAKYNYLALARAGAQKGRLQEFRTDAKGKPVPPEAQNGMVTVGFVAMSVHFHPEYQTDSRFRYLGREPMEKQDTYVVAFAQRPTVARQVESVRFFGRGGIVFTQGVAWIDPVSFRIVRLRTDLQRPELNVGLLKETTQVLYSEVSFTQSGKMLWLPREVTVTGQLGRYSFHNQHRYSDYRLFKVEVEQKEAKP